MNIRSPYISKPRQPKIPTLGEGVNEIFRLSKELGINEVTRLVQELKVLKDNLDSINRNAESLTSEFQNKIEEVNNANSILNQKIQDAQIQLERAKQIQKGDKGIPGDSADNPTDEHLLSLILPFIPQVSDGKTPTTEEIKAIVEPMIPKVTDGKTPTKAELLNLIVPLIPDPKTTSFEPDDVFINKLIEKIVKGKKLKMEHVDGLNSAQQVLRNYVANGSRHGAGTTIKAGSNITLTPNSDGTTTVAAGGGSFSILTATGTVDDSNKVFTFISTPTLVVVNGVSYRNGHGVTIVTTTATLDNPVGTGGDIYAIG